MIGWGLAVFVGLMLIFWDMKPVNRARLLGHPMLIHIIVLGSGFALHGGSAQGAMAAVISGVFSAVYCRIARRWYGYLHNGVWHPGVKQFNDPRLV